MTYSDVRPSVSSAGGAAANASSQGANANKTTESNSQTDLDQRRKPQATSLLRSALLPQILPTRVPKWHRRRLSKLKLSPPSWKRRHEPIHSVRSPAPCWSVSLSD